MRLLALITLAITLTGCNMTPAERAELSRMLNSTGDDIQRMNRNTAQRIYTSNPPAAYVPSASSGQSRSFMFNTPDGIVQKTCKKTNSNYVYCY